MNPRPAKSRLSREVITGRYTRLEPLTLSHLDDYAGLPGHIVHSASQACLATTASSPPFEVKLDRAKSFGGRPGNRPFILCDDNGNIDLRNFQKRLVAELVKHGCPCDYGAFTPHLTLLYDDKIIPRAPIDPVRWMAGEIILIHSLLGKTQYYPLGSWPLGSLFKPVALSCPPGLHPLLTQFFGSPRRPGFGINLGAATPPP